MNRATLKRTGFKQPANLADALARKLAREAKKLRRGPKRVGLERKPGARLTAKVDRKLVAWSKAVRERDDYTCQMTGIRDVERNIAHHRAPRSRRPDLRLDIANGVTLTPESHQWVHDNPKAATEAGRVPIFCS